VDDATGPEAGTTPAGANYESDGRAARLAAQRRGGRRRAVLAVAVGALLLGGVTAGYALLFETDDAATATALSAENSVATAPPTTVTPATTKPPTTTTTTTVPRIKQPGGYAMPSPGNGLRQGSRGPVVALYETRMRDLHFDPGEVDGVFDSKTRYAVVSVQKYFGQRRTGVIDAGVQAALSRPFYVAAQPNSERNRVEIDLDRQVLTVFKDGQPTLITTTSTGNGDYFCGGADGCQYAVTPTGHYHFYELYRGWKKGKLGTMWNPYFFNGGIAVHGLDSVPAEPASHGCARIPMYVANYFPDLVSKGMSVFVVGTPKERGDRYVGPVRNRPRSRTPVTTAPPVVPNATPTTKPLATPTTPKPTPTTQKPTPTTPPTTP
jgi:peptidoglycan hydrolase-like protein with peptidoglycan-binding domain